MTKAAGSCPLSESSPGGPLHTQRRSKYSNYSEHSAWMALEQSCLPNQTPSIHICSLPVFRGRGEPGTLWCSGQRAGAGIWPLPCKLPCLSLPGAPPPLPSHLSTAQTRRGQTFPAQGMDVNVFIVMGHPGSVVTTRLCHCSKSSPGKDGMNE